MATISYSKDIEFITINRWKILAKKVLFHTLAAARGKLAVMLVLHCLLNDV